VVSFGMLVPPMGLNVYVVNGMSPGVPLAETFRGVLPFLVSDFIRIGLILAFPGIALWLVRFMS
jgi:C4-dicarboxylate transporter, DctM subunit